jgi:hypothetical protein
MKTYLGRRNASTGRLIQIYDFTIRLAILVGATDFYSVQNIQTGSGVQLTCFPINKGVTSRG